ncbi:hypothetical protein SGGMMB4_02686 [Sodalis glossinidius str. 'morsitans']|uniref:Hypothetical phage protein n=1 Tax=Sodalis glossinidius (strain morsitans) TaxID=343509 RepID=Q2NTS2_SODGM|nr:hypothetical protein [Sodalis glossinidius]BAE74453.1 hypothetical phage protein [Sodalis glossinidius str. 'morsitans']CRL45140.1 hypothetical protein SGGMMB4_02686 [Sodalis glossinidius str. 'morsitans']
MRDFGKVSPQFWIGKTGRDLKKMGPEALIVAMYLLTSPHSNMLGLYYIPVQHIAYETGLGMEGASKGLQGGVETGFCHYDFESEMVWVIEMAKYQIGAYLKPKDNQCLGIQRLYDSLPENYLLSMFFDKYHQSFHLTNCRENCRGFGRKKARASEGAYKALRSQEKEIEKEKEKDKHLLPGAEKTQLQAGEKSCGELPDGFSGSEPDAEPSHAQPETGVRPLSDGASKPDAEPPHAEPDTGMRPLSGGASKRGEATQRNGAGLHAPSEPVFISLPLNDGSEFSVTEALVTEFESLYPAVDVRQELRNQRGWLLAQPRRRKTRRGIRRFVSGWMCREQDRAGRTRSPTAQAATGLDWDGTEWANELIDKGIL